MKTTTHNLGYYLRKNGVEHADEVKASKSIELRFSSLKVEAPTWLLALLGFALYLIPISGTEWVVITGYIILTAIIAVLLYFIFTRLERMMEYGDRMGGLFWKMQWDRFLCIKHFRCDPLTTDRETLKKKVVGRLEQLVAEIKKLPDCQKWIVLNSKYSNLRDIAKVWVEIPTCAELFK